VKSTGKPGAGKRHAGFDEAGAGNVTKGAGLKTIAKAGETPPDPTVGVPVLDPTCEGLGVKFPRATQTSEALKHWLQRVEVQNVPGFAVFLTTLDHWFEEITNYFPA
jgi:hypothetical protein